MNHGELNPRNIRLEVPLTVIIDHGFLPNEMRFPANILMWTLIKFGWDRCASAWMSGVVDGWLGPASEPTLWGRTILRLSRVSFAARVAKGLQV